MRYRNPIWPERDRALGRFVLTPYIYDYGTSTSARVPNRYAAGGKVPAGDLRQDDLDTPQHVNALGLTFIFYFRAPGVDGRLAM